MDNALTLDEIKDKAALVEAQAAAYPMNMEQEVGVKVTLTTIDSVVHLLCCSDG